jgi:hypothetical protein
MQWLNYVAYFFGGACLANAIAHFVNGIMGRAFQSPFAKPRGQGLSSSIANVLWGFFNAVVGYLLIWHVGDFDVRNVIDVIVAALGGLLLALWLANHFGRFNGGRL